MRSHKPIMTFTGLSLRGITVLPNILQLPDPVPLMVVMHHCRAIAGFGAGG